MTVNLDKLVPAARLRGDDDTDTELLRKMEREAEDYIRSFRWCRRVIDSYFGLGVGGVVAVFLFRIEGESQEVDEWLWVVVGDVPSAYLVTDAAPNAACALKAYIEEMDRWVNAARTGMEDSDLIPVNVAPTPENAEMLDKRLRFIQRDILPDYRDDLNQCT